MKHLLSQKEIWLIDLKITLLLNHIEEAKIMLLLKMYALMTLKKLTFRTRKSFIKVKEDIKLSNC